MARTETVIDTGPLVAYFDRRDEYHAWSKQQMAHLRVPLSTSEAVLSEAFHLLEDVPHGTQQLLDFLTRGAVTVLFSYVQHAERVHELMRAYADQPMSFADACLVRMAELRPESRIFTTDGDFHVYRKTGGEHIDVLAPGMR